MQRLQNKINTSVFVVNIPDTDLWTHHHVSTIAIIDFLVNVSSRVETSHRVKFRTGSLGLCLEPGDQEDKKELLIISLLRNTVVQGGPTPVVVVSEHESQPSQDRVNRIYFGSGH